MRFAYYAHFNSISDCEGWIATTLERQGHYVLRVQRDRDAFVPAALIKAIRQSEADYLLLSKTPEITRDQLVAVKEATGVKVVFWTFDWMRDPANWRWYAPLAQVADICFQTDGWGEPEYEEAGIRRVELHQGAFPDIHRPVTPTDREKEKYTADVAFCGSLYTPRRHELHRELRRYPAFKLWGPSTEELWGRDFAVMVACTKIIVCDNYVNHVPGYWSDRIYLTMACGGFCLASHVQGIDREFDIEKQINTWGSFQALHTLIQHYLNLPVARRFIATEGQYEVKNNHRYDVRVRTMTKYLEAL